MKPHPRIRKTIKWGGAVVTVLLLGASLSSRGKLHQLHTDPRLTVLLLDGKLSVAFSAAPNPGVLVLTRFARKAGAAGPPWIECDLTSDTKYVLLPLSLASSLVLLPTAFAWYLDRPSRRRALLHRCPKCNYDRGGIAGDAKCPECGCGGSSMKPHPRIRKTIKWGGAVVTVLLLVVWIESGWWTLMWVRPPRTMIGIRVGSIYLCKYPFGALEDLPHGFRTPVRELQSRMSFLQDSRTIPSGVYEALYPLWILPAATTLATAAAWVLDSRARRRARLNLCPKCHYDRAGIGGDAVCPECGRTAP